MDIIFLLPSQGEHGGARAHQRDAQRKVSIFFSQRFIHNPYLVLVSLGFYKRSPQGEQRLEHPRRRPRRAHR